MKKEYQEQNQQHENNQREQRQLEQRTEKPLTKEIALEHIAIVGKSGTGKTTFAVKLIMKTAKKYSLVVYLNTQGDKFVNEMTPYHAETVEELKEHIDNNIRIVVYNIPLSLDEEISDTEFFYQLFKYLWEIKINNPEKEFLFIIDECQDFATNYIIPYHYQLAMKRGRMWRFTLMNITQRCQDVNKTVLSQTKYFYMFNLTGWDYDYMLKRVPFYKNPPKVSYVYLAL